MKQYTVKSGQNIYDVAMTLFGSIEGVLDLLVNNQDLSYESNLVAGQQLSYDEDFVINQDIVDWFGSNHVVVKNGCHALSHESVKNKFQAAIASSNEEVTDKLAHGKITIVYDIADPVKPWRPGLGGSEVWEDYNDDSINTDVVATSLATTSINPSSSSLTVKIISSSETMNASSHGVSDNFLHMTDLADKVKRAVGIDLKMDKLSNYWIAQNLNMLFENGMMFIPEIEADASEYYEFLSKPKIYIHQKGVSSVIGFDVNPNDCVIIDWGDGSELEYYHFNSVLQYVSHTYNDYSEHLVKLYGANDYFDLDLADAGGKYSLLENIYIDHCLRTPWPDDKNLNALFILKDN